MMSSSLKVFLFFGYLEFSFNRMKISKEEPFQKFALREKVRTQSCFLEKNQTFLKAGYQAAPSSGRRWIGKHHTFSIVRPCSATSRTLPQHHKYWCVDGLTNPSNYWVCSVVPLGHFRKQRLFSKRLLGLSAREKVEHHFLF
jgi:hypothetical protein